VNPIPVEDIASIPSLLAKSAYMFVHQHLRDGVWNSLFTEHVMEFYEGKELNNARTNFPRRLGEDKDWGWAAYIEALAILSRAYRTLTLEVTLSRGGVLRSYKLNITRDRNLWDHPSGSVIVNNFRQKNSLYLPTDSDRTNETLPTHIIRETIRLDKLPIGVLEDKIITFFKDPSNTHTFTVNEITVQKASLLATLKRGRIAWNNVPRILKLLGFKSVSLNITATLGDRKFSSIVGLSL
jgi:hypothetical protein